MMSAADLLEAEAANNQQPHKPKMPVRPIKAPETPPAPATIASEPEQEDVKIETSVTENSSTKSRKPEHKKAKEKALGAAQRSFQHRYAKKRAVRRWMSFWSGLGLIAAATVALFLTSVSIHDCDSNGMERYAPDGGIFIMNNIAYLAKDPQRCEIVQFIFEDQGRSYDMVRRIVGMPGEKISIRHNTLYINGKEYREDYASGTFPDDIDITLGSGQYLLLADERDNLYVPGIVLSKENIAGELMIGVTVPEEIKQTSAWAMITNII